MIPQDWEEFQKKCYFFARYQNNYQQDGTFNERVLALLSEGEAFGRKEAAAFLEQMIAHGSEYEEMDRKWCPILVYVGDPECYGVLNGFARRMGEALERRGIPVEYFNPYEGDVSRIADYAGQRFRAVLGFQTFAFGIELGNGECFHDHIQGSKFNMILDHPMFAASLLNAPPMNYCVLTQDANYASYVERFFPQVQRAFLFPPAGVSIGEPQKERDYDIVFVGTYYDWRPWRGAVQECNRSTGGIVRRFVSYMLRHRDHTWEMGLEMVLREITKELGASGVAAAKMQKRRWELAERALREDGAFHTLLCNIRLASFLVMYRIREELLDVIVADGLPVHVFGESFEKGRYVDAANFIRHPAVTPEASLSVYARTKISVNLLSWHKAGMTERVANAMLNGAVCFTDTSSYLEQEYIEGEDYAGFSLDDLERVPMQLRKLLADENKLCRLRESAYRKASDRETWDDRAEKFLSILNDMPK